MPKITDPQSCESIYDPTCGSGGILLSSSLHVKEQGKEYRTLKLYGQELNLITSAIARINMFMHNVDEFLIVQGDTLDNPQMLRDLFGEKLQFGNFLDENDFETVKFDKIALHISERVEPQKTALDIYVGLEHLEPDNLIIEKTGKPDDVISLVPTRCVGTQIRRAALRLLARGADKLGSHAARGNQKNT